MAERHRQDAIDGIKYSIYTYELSKVRYGNIIKVANDSSLYVGSNRSVLVMAVQQSDGLEIRSCFQSLGPSFDAPVLTSHSGWKRGEQVAG